MSRFHRLANPTRFARLSRRVLPYAAAVAAGLFAIGVYGALALAPPDYQQGETVRIMFIHVPAAWMALFVYVLMAAFSAMALIWRHPLAEISAKACAPLGAGFTLIALATGALWGQPMWGTWWVWDGRLTSVLILFFLYLGYIALWQTVEDPAKAGRAAAILALVGAVNVPIIHFSVEWWNTLHQPASVFRMDGPTIHPDMLWPLFVMLAAFKAYFVTLLLWRIRGEVLARRITVLQMMQAASASGDSAGAMR